MEGGETIREAALRELREETGVVAEALGLLEPFDVFHRDEEGHLLAQFVLVPVRCRWLSGSVAAASDAGEAAWFGISRLEQTEVPVSARVLPLARAAQDDG